MLRSRWSGKNHIIMLFRFCAEKYKISIHNLFNI